MGIIEGSYNIANLKQVIGRTKFETVSANRGDFFDVEFLLKGFKKPQISRVDLHLKIFDDIRKCLSCENTFPHDALLIGEVGERDLLLVFGRQELVLA